MGDFFKKYGFCLINSPTEVKDWNEDYFNPTTDISKHYHAEVTAMANKIYETDPDYDFYKIDMHFAVLKRGPGS